MTKKPTTCVILESYTPELFGHLKSVVMLVQGSLSNLFSF